MSDQSSDPHGGEAIVWSLLGTLLSGPVLYGLVGFAVDEFAGTSVGVPIGIVVGFVLSGYIIYMRYGRD